MDIDNRSPNDIILKWQEESIHKEIKVRRFSQGHYRNVLRSNMPPSAVIVRGFNTKTNSSVDLNERPFVLILPSLKQKQSVILVMPDGKTLSFLKHPCKLTIF